MQAVSLPQFFLESSFCLFIFYLFYHFFLRKVTFFQVNRAYLLLTPLAALLIPLLHINIQRPDINNLAMDVIVYPTVTNYRIFKKMIANQFIDGTAPTLTFTIGDFFIFIYFIGVLFMLVKLIIGLSRLLMIIYNSRQQKLKGCTVINASGKVPASSFFSYIFWGGDKITPDELLVIEHELVHVRQRHSIDVLMMEFWVILKWFNPLIYLYRSSLRAIHEYIADQYVIQHAAPAEQYAKVLANRNDKNSKNFLLNYLASGLLKNRLNMLRTNKSKRHHLYRYLLSIPVFFALMALFSFNLVKTLPQLPGGVKQQVTDVKDYFSDWSTTTIIGNDESVASTTSTFIKWGEQSIESALINNKEQHKIKGAKISLADFAQIKDQPFYLMHNNTTLIPAEINIRINGPNFSAISCREQWTDKNCTNEQIKNITSNSSIEILLKSAAGEHFYAIICISDTENYSLYLPESAQSLAKGLISEETLLPVVFIDSVIVD